MTVIRTILPWYVSYKFDYCPPRVHHDHNDYHLFVLHVVGLQVPRLKCPVVGSLAYRSERIHNRSSYLQRKARVQNAPCIHPKKTRVKICDWDPDVDNGGQ
jgi:hypothetical protein